MSLKERVDNIIAYYNNYGANDINDCINRLDTLLKNEPSVTGYRIGKDTDVFESSGVDIYYVSVAWVDGNGLNLCGGPVYSC